MTVSLPLFSASVQELFQSNRPITGTRATAISRWLLVLLLLAFSTAGRSQCFKAATSFNTNAKPASVVTGDFNGDGKSDLVTVNTEANTISLLLNDGTGSFGPATDFAVGNSPRSATAGDFNGDGKLDLATANATNTVSILLGNGSGNFSITSVAVPGIPVSVAIGDFNSDDALDLITATYGGGSVTLLPGNGMGGFGSQSSFSLGHQPVSVTVGDFNGDGKPDLVTANQNTTALSVLLNNGSGGFGAVTTVNTGGGAASVAVGDFNGDNKLDLATPSYTTKSVSLLLGTGTGTFGSATDFSLTHYPSALAPGDFNADGKLDLAVADAGNTVSVLLGTGSGNFGAETVFGVDPGVISVVAGDVNGDGRADLATSNYNAKSVSILLNCPVQANPATISVSPAALSGFTTDHNTPSAAKQFQLIAAGFPPSSTFYVNPPLGYELSFDGTLYGTNLGVPVDFNGANSTTIYVRLRDLQALGLHEGNITFDSQLPDQPILTTVALSGTVTNGNQPTATISDNVLTGFFHVAPGQPSAVQSYVFSASNYAPTTTFRILAGAGYEISFSAAAGFASELMVAVNGQGAVQTTVYARMKATAASNAQATITHQVVISNITTNLSIFTNVGLYSPHATITPGTLSGFATTQGTASAAQSVVVNAGGYPYPSQVQLAAPAGYEFSSGGPYAQTLSFDVNSSGSLLNTTISVRLSAGASAGSHNATLSIDPSLPTVPVLATLALTGTVTAGNANLPPIAPVISNASATVGISFSQVIPLFMDPEGLPLTYSVTGLPAGLLFADGSVSGTPSAAGSFPVTVTATDQGGLTAQITYTLTINPAPVGNQLLQLLQPLYNCQTGAITFQTSGGDGSPVEYRAIGIADWSTNPSQVLDAAVRQDVNSQPIPMQARQGQTMVSYSFDSRGYCNNGNPVSNQAPVFHGPLASVNGSLGSGFDYFLPPNVFTDPDAGDVLTYTATNLPPGLVLATGDIVGLPTTAGTYAVTLTATDPGGLMATGTIMIVITNGGQPPVGNQLLQLHQPLYNCQTGAITFQTSGGDGSPISFFCVGVVGGSTQTSYVLEAAIRNDVNSQPLTIQATQSGVTVSYVFDWRGYCGQARIGVAEVPDAWTLRSLGNPVTSEVVVELAGATGQPVTVSLISLTGRVVESRLITPTTGQHREVFDVTGQGAGILLLRAESASRNQTLKLIKQ